MEYLIPDISHHDKVTSWSKLAKETPFVIIKGTQRCNFVSPTLKTYIKNLEKYKVPYWIYSYLEKGNEEDQAKFLTATCDPIIGESFIGYSLDAEEKNKPDDVLRAIRIVQGARRKVLVYTPYSIWSKVKGDVANDTDVIFWEPRYGLNNGKYNPLFPPHSDCALHQFTDKGKVDYISGNCDLNRLTGIVPIEWFTTKFSNTYPYSPDDRKTKKCMWNGEIPKFPKRGYFKKGDGITTALKFKEDIKRAQKIIRWVSANDGLTIDGKFGAKTKEAVITSQKFLNVKPDGIFGPATLSAALKYKSNNPPILD